MESEIRRMKCSMCKSIFPVFEVCVDVIWHSEQNEGKQCKPYKRRSRLTCCSVCANKIKKGVRVHAAGVGGVNNYVFDDDPNWEINVWRSKYE